MTEQLRNEIAATAVVKRTGHFFIKSQMELGRYLAPEDLNKGFSSTSSE